MEQRRQDQDDSRYCRVCYIEKKPKMGHCNDCGICIEGLDHHCPWVTKCVGRGNMLWFIIFVIGMLAWLVLTILTVSTVL